MAEKRRLFIKLNRLRDEIDSNGELELTSNESHYLHRVMRMRSEDLLEVIDGKGHLWNAKIVEKKTIKLTNGFDKPLRFVSRERPLIGIAIVIPKKGFENFLQMSCEIGVDIIQPLISKRSVVKESNSEKTIRYKKIIYEAVEQSERLWSPELMQVLTFPNWINDMPSGTQVGFAATRIQDLQDCVTWVKETPHDVNQVWVVIGPEGGWNKDEEELAFEAGLVGVSMGETILRTSTAAVSACQIMTSWRRLKSSL
ncbi:16S rRNA (uracil(1498)-N(3))-methyltransferase [Prochlorococcus sp. MIT 0801]|uniref:16S rRNA (uracil(1498)-N(3))-methyltransferase n=1 Tax=Prochlorococcus sp. MIT 0801 TaxID=1501269 RepID=UPI0004F64677|nr:16S rRNA (uracil(1498)-N(3))-methyltransferase [Prochlorococcus sp. MIT 0801]AIQ96861.1 Ribosomal RNA small subunit methyltransferase E [Prochlorococcus sp. MIT 0801]